MLVISWFKYYFVLALLFTSLFKNANYDFGPILSVNETKSDVPSPPTSTANDSGPPPPPPPPPPPSPPAYDPGKGTPEAHAPGHGQGTCPAPSPISGPSTIIFGSAIIFIVVIIFCCCYNLCSRRRRAAQHRVVRRWVVRRRRRRTWTTQQVTVGGITLTAAMIRRIVRQQQQSMASQALVASTSLLSTLGTADGSGCECSKNTAICEDETRYVSDVACSPNIETVIVQSPARFDCRDLDGMPQLKTVVLATRDQCEWVEDCFCRFIFHCPNQADCCRQDGQCSTPAEGGYATTVTVVVILVPCLALIAAAVFYLWRKGVFRAWFTMIMTPAPDPELIELGPVGQERIQPLVPTAPPPPPPPPPPSRVLHSLPRLPWLRSTSPLPSPIFDIPAVAGNPFRLAAGLAWEVSTAPSTSRIRPIVAPLSNMGILAETVEIQVDEEVEEEESFYETA